MIYFSPNENGEISRAIYLILSLHIILLEEIFPDQEKHIFKKDSLKILISCAFPGL
jgi:hypothetical protein